MSLLSSRRRLLCARLIVKFQQCCSVEKDESVNSLQIYRQADVLADGQPMYYRRSEKPIWAFCTVALKLYYHFDNQWLMKIMTKYVQMQDSSYEKTWILCRTFEMVRYKAPNMDQKQNSISHMKKNVLIKLLLSIIVLFLPLKINFSGNLFFIKNIIFEIEKGASLHTTCPSNLTVITERSKYLTVLKRSDTSWEINQSIQKYSHSIK